jgi:hypothetical protein
VNLIRPSGADKRIAYQGLDMNILVKTRSGTSLRRNKSELILRVSEDKTVDVKGI